jgi:hypothetical protein
MRSQPASNPQKAQTPKHNNLQSPLVVVVYSNFISTTTIDKPKNLTTKKNKTSSMVTQIIKAATLNLNRGNNRG